MAVGWSTGDDGRGIPPCFSYGCMSSEITTAYVKSEKIKDSCMESLGYTVTGK